MDRDIRLLISDFDGTLADTFRANMCAYRQAFRSVGLQLDEELYSRCYGLRFDRFMTAAGVFDRNTAALIRQRKEECYPSYFHLLRVNAPLLGLIRAFRRGGGLTALASTARRANLTNALTHIGATTDFDLVLAGEDVSCGKPSPEIYTRILEHFGTAPQHALVFEDSPAGMEAAERAGIAYVKTYIGV